MACGGEDVFAVEADPGGEFVVGGEEAGGGGVGDYAWGGLGEDVGGHGGAEGAGEVDGIEGSEFLEVGERDGVV